MIKQTIFTGWHFMRWIRLGLGIIFVVYAIRMHDTLSGFMAAIFLFQAVTNTGCCGVNSCTVPTAKTHSANPEEIEFEEIKEKQK